MDRLGGRVGAEVSEGSWKVGSGPSQSAQGKAHEHCALWDEHRASGGPKAGLKAKVTV